MESTPATGRRCGRFMDLWLFGKYMAPLKGFLASKEIGGGPGCQIMTNSSLRWKLDPALRCYTRCDPGKSAVWLFPRQLCHVTKSEMSSSPFVNLIFDASAEINGGRHSTTSGVSWQPSTSTNYRCLLIPSHPFPGSFGTRYPHQLR